MWNSIWTVTWVNKTLEMKKETLGVNSVTGERWIIFKRCNRFERSLSGVWADQTSDLQKSSAIWFEFGSISLPKASRILSPIKNTRSLERRGGSVGGSEFKTINPWSTDIHFISLHSNIPYTPDHHILKYLYIYVFSLNCNMKKLLKVSPLFLFLKTIEKVIRLCTVLKKNYLIGSFKDEAIFHVILEIDGLAR